MNGTDLQRIERERYLKIPQQHKVSLDIDRRQNQWKLLAHKKVLVYLRKNILLCIIAWKYIQSSKKVEPRAVIINKFQSTAAMLK